METTLWVPIQTISPKIVLLFSTLLSSPLRRGQHLIARSDSFVGTRTEQDTGTKETRTRFCYWVGKGLYLSSLVTHVFSLPVSLGVFFGCGWRQSGHTSLSHTG